MRDEKESGERKCLNVGHTTGHVVELTYGSSHGESVLWGMKLETMVAIDCGVCEKAYGERLLKFIDKALVLAPKAAIDLSKLGDAAMEKAGLDKKNKDDGNVVMSVAKAYGEWTLFSLPMDAYVSALQNAINKL